MQTSPEKALMTEAARPEPSRVYRWIVLFVVSLTMFGNYYVYDCIAPIADLLVKQLGFSDANIGLLQAIYSIPNVFMVLIGGYVVDRIGTRKGIFIFGTLCLLGSILTVLSGRLGLMAAGRLVFGLGAESLRFGDQSVKRILYWCHTHVLFDYIYVSFTNSIAFSPTDTMPLTRRAKALMLAESAVSAVAVLLVAARAVNIFK